ncbi:MAG: hypothetical protein ACYC91_06755 [Solirubrobacteraceae bacterium]
MRARSLRRCAAGVLGALALLGAVAPGAVAARRHRPARCRLAYSRVIARSGRAALYQHRSHGAVVIYACHRATGRRVTLFSSAARNELKRFSLPRLVDPYAAFVLDTIPAFGNASTRIVVVNIASGRTQYSLMPAPDVPDSPVTDLVLGTQGYTAWIHGTDASNLEVRARDGQALQQGVPDRLVDQGPIVTGSLLIDPATNTFSWKGGNSCGADASCSDTLA